MRFRYLAFVMLLGVLSPPVFADLNDGLVAYYEFEDNANDSVGENHGIEHGGLSYDTGKIGQAAVFNGIDSYITALPLTVKSGDFTISLWFISTSDKYGQLLLSDNPVCHFRGKGFSLTVYSHKAQNQPRIDLQLGTGRVAHNEIYYDDQWHNIVGVSNKVTNKIRLYIDGKLLEQETGIYIPSSDPFWIGESSADYNISYCGSENEFDGVKGMIDDLRFYNRALSESEIQQLYQMDNQPAQPSDECWATYENGSLHIPCIKVKGPFGDELLYEADMQYQPLSDPMTFQVTGAKAK